MKLFKTFTTIALLAVTVTVSSVSAQGKPGIDRPIRIGMFKGTGPGNAYWHSNIHTAVAALTSMLANPAEAGLGDSLVIPPKGFTFMNSGVGPVSSTNPAECSGSGCGPTATQITDFIAAMDTLDVLFISCFVDWGNRVTNATQREAFANFWTNKAYVAVHATTDSYGRWAPQDSIHGARFRGHPSSDRNGRLVRDSVFESEAAFKYLNRGLFVNGLDTTFLEEWFFFTTPAATIRSVAFLKPTVKLDESSLAGGLGGQAAMGDHPMSWYRQLPTGGRFFYTAVGHRPNNWQGGTQPRFLRRQIYNAFLWTVKYDSLSSTSINYKTGKAPGDAFNYAKLSVKPSELTVTVMQAGDHAVELVGMDGKRLGSRRGEGVYKAYSFNNLRPGVYAVVVYTPQGRSDRLVTIQ